MIRVSLPVLALLLSTAVVVVRANSGNNLIRKRREWILPPKPLLENHDYTNKDSIAQIRSDVNEGKDLTYSLEGAGANQYPFHVFVVDAKTGKIRVTKILDREEIHQYNLSGIAWRSDGTIAEKKIDIRIKVIDVNDNDPTFSKIPDGEVEENSPPGTTVMKVTATDADEKDNENSQIAYSIIDQTPYEDMFYMTRDGSIVVKQPTLDRERRETYVLTVKGQDLNGKEGGRIGTGTVTINVLDVNDNLPTLEKDHYEGNIEENTEGVEVMRLKVEDLDKPETENWEAVFDIVKGNEAGYFSIKTDPNTNDGILMLDKPVDYEDVKDLDLGILVKNKAGPHGSLVTAGFGATGASGASGASVGSSRPSYKTYPIKINVKNQPEGPRFVPKVKAIHTSEEGRINLKDVIGVYPAIDGDTGKPAENVRYAKIKDKGNWITFDPKTAEIRLNKIPDRESPFLVNGTYYAEVICIPEDMPTKTATGTIAIQVEDFNDHCPTLTSGIQTLCTTQDAFIVNAVDEDADPNGPPFNFKIQEGSKGKWVVEHHNETATILRAHETLWPGFYEVELQVTDQQGEACPEPQKVKIQVCTCEDGVEGNAEKKCMVKSNSTSEFGPVGICLLLLGLLLLALLPLLLLFCQCGTILSGNFESLPNDTKSYLMKYNTEGQGENVDWSPLTIPPKIDTGVKIAPGFGNETAAGKSLTSIDGMNMDIAGDQQNWGIHQQNWGVHQQNWGVHQQNWGAHQERVNGLYNEWKVNETRGRTGVIDSMALPDHFLGEYYSQKVTSLNQGSGIKDGLLLYNYEGQDSPAGSVDSCSNLESDNNLQFLDDLGPKFKTLAEVCGGTKITTEVKTVSTPQPSTSINTHTSVTSLVTDKKLSPPPQLQPLVPKMEETVVRDTSERSQMVRESKAAVSGGVANQGQMFLLQQQQPMYYTTTPVLQPMHYVVQPQVQNTMLLADAPANNLQGMVLVNSTQTGPVQGVVTQGQTLISSAQTQGPSMVLVERSGVQAGGTNLIHTGNLSGSQTMMVMEGNVPAGTLKMLKGGQTTVVQGGTVQPGGFSGSQRVLVVGGQTRSEDQLVQEAEGVPTKRENSQRVLYSKNTMSTGSQNKVVGSSSTISTGPSYRKVVVQETKEFH